ncbi:MAG: DUF6443 domain-containing protein [Tunicatimonas sp.]
MRLLQPTSTTLPTILCWVFLLFLNVPFAAYSSSPSYEKVPVHTTNVEVTPPIFPVQAGDIWLEAEEADAIGSIWSLEDDPDASGGEYLQVASIPGGSSFTRNDAARQVVFNINVTQAGNYHLFVRHKSLNGEDDSFFFKVNDGEWIQWNTLHLGGFYWEKALQAYALVSGANTIRIATRESDFRLDRIYLTQHGDYPYGKGEGDTTSPPRSQNWLEAEVVVPGTNWTTQDDAQASAGKYAVFPEGPTASVPSENAADQLVYTVAVPQEDNYFLFVRANAPDISSNSLWFKVDDGPWISKGRLDTGEGFVWNILPFSPFRLTAGAHRITVVYRETGVELDRFYLSNNSDFPTGKGAEVAPPQEIIIDNKSPGFSTNGSWVISSQQQGNRYGPDYVHDDNKNKGSKTATFQATVTPGTYQVYGWWSASSNRATNVPYDIVTACGEIATTTVNQRANGASWQLLGTYNFNETAQVILRTDGTNGYVIADAIKLTSLTTSTAPERVAIDNTDPGFSTTGSWQTSTANLDSYQSDYAHDGNSGKGSKTATFQSVVTPGSYEVFAWWTSHPNRATNVPFDVIHQAGTSTVVKNQQQQGGGWVSLGTYDFGTAAQVTIRTTETNGYVMADGVLFVGGGEGTFTPCKEPYTPPTPPSIVNNPPDGTTAPSVGGDFLPIGRPISNVVGYVRSFTPRELYNQPSQVTMSTPVSDVSVSTQYTDGQGRPIQTVVRGGSGSASQDMVQRAEYDPLGRAVRQYLPYTVSSSTGAYRPDAPSEQYNFYISAPGDVTRSEYAYAETRYEESPLGRVVRQGSTGKTYRVDGEHAVTQQYRSNTGGDAVRRWTVSSTTPSTPGTYGAGTLYVTTLTDANDHRVTEFTNQTGQTVLKRVQGPAGNMDTYYVYDVYDQLRYTIPPEATQRLSGNWSQAGSTTFQQQWMFGYQYDNWGNVIVEQVPGGGTTYYVYDAWDRPVLVQTATMRQQNASRWAYTKYDYLDRPVLTGIYAPGSNRASLQTAARNNTVRAMSTTSGGVGYNLSQGFPSVSEASIRSVSYYDNYSFPHASQAAYGAGGTSHRSAVKSLMTGSMTRKLDDNTWLKDVTYYDEQYRPIVTASDNHQGGTDRLTTTYRNAVNDEVLSTTLTHNGQENHTITQGYTYDHMGRLTGETHRLDQGATMTLATHTYNVLGQRVQKQMNSGQQTVDYRYHIRGWLTKINELGSSDDFFAQELFYDYGFAQKQYNGNLAGVQWSRAGGQQHAYGYVYDEADRLTGADYRHRPAAGGWAATPGNYTVDQVSYDRNGNIQRLKRYGQVQELQYALDDLDYDYSGNRLTAVNESGDGQAELGFKDAGSGNDEYAYDAGGNLTQDQNKGITNITYDALLNLPLVVSLNTGTIRYTYDAAGNRLSQRTEDENGVLLSETDYLGAFEYRNGELALVHHSEGRVSFAQGASGNYHFDLRDHLGNVRVTFSDQPVTTTATATMETAAAPTEEALFMGVAQSRHTLAFHNTTDASSEELNPNKVATLLPGQQGPAKSLLVHAGDEVHLEVNARYETVPSQVQGMEGIATQVAGALQQSAAGLESAGAASGTNGLAAGGALATGQEQAVPKAYLNYLLYDENYQLVDQGFRQVSEAAAVGKANPEVSPEALTVDIAVAEDGFLYTYLSNEVNGSALSAVYFDDFTVEQQSYIVAVNDYYPFGGSHDQETMIGVENKYRYQGKELQAELGLDLYDFHARQYDPLLGRFLSYDPAGQFASGFVGMGNNPITGVDPDGEFVFSAILPGVGVFIDAALWGAVIGGAGYTASAGLSDGGFQNWDSGQFWKSVGIGAISGVATAGVGSALGPVGSGGIAGEVGRAYAHGFAQGTISEFSGGDFITGFASGGLGSLGGSAFMMYGGKAANSTAGLYAFSGLAGGAGSAATGGNFWEGAALGVMNAGLNHARANISAAGARYFANKKAFYDYLQKNSFDKNGNPIREVSGWELENGDAIALPYDKNYVTKGGTYVSRNDALNVVPGKFNTKWVQFKGTGYQIHTHAHTHPQSYGLYPQGYQGGPDAAMIRFVNNPIRILHNSNLYRVGLGSSGAFSIQNLGRW